MNRRSILFLALSLVALGCGEEGWSPPDPDRCDLASDGTIECGSEDVLLVAESSEIQLGAKVHAEIVKEFGEPLPEGHPLSVLVTALGQTLVRHSARRDLPHRFFVLDAEMVNAFAGPGGYVYVTTGLIRAARSTAELVGVMAHEVGHVSEAHAIKSLQIQLGAQYLIDLAVGADSDIGQVVSVLTNIYLSTGYSQSNELDADAFGVIATAESGYNPWGFVQFFETIDGMQPDEVEDLFKWISSHPETEVRIEQATGIIQRKYPDAPRGGVTGASNRYRYEDADQPWSAIQGLLPAGG